MNKGSKVRFHVRSASNWLRVEKSFHVLCAKVDSKRNKFSQSTLSSPEPKTEMAVRG
jgi:hypothetical protein